MIRFNSPVQITKVCLAGHEPKALSKREEKKLRKGKLDPKKLDDGKSVVFDPPILIDPGTMISCSTESQPSKGPWWKRALCWLRGHQPPMTRWKVDAPKDVCETVAFCQRCGREIS